MLKPRIEKVVVNLNVGKSGEPLEKANKVLKEITGQTPVKKKSQENHPRLRHSRRRINRCCRYLAKAKGN